MCPRVAIAPMDCYPHEQRQPPLRAAAPNSGIGLPCGLALAAVGCPLAGGLGRSLAMGGWPYIGAGRGWSPLLQAAFAAEMQQERVERFYAIQSHHTGRKENKRWWLKLQLINHESPLIFIESHQKP
ncbi:hypothetical protein GW17_00052565 [Ensete ventricosum]|nr:hypothetical protein GW17_00052565 [Ensete ventricosum]